MEIKRKWPFNRNGIVTLVFIVLGFISIQSVASMPLFTIAVSNRSLTVSSIPLQQALANSNFSFNLAPYINMLKPEVDYQVTSNLRRTCSNLALIELPRGLTRAYDGDNVCSEVFSLNPQQSCLLRFYVDINTYVHSKRGGPIVCLSPSGLSCSRPSSGAQIDDVVARAPGPTQLLVTPAAQDGLRYDPATYSIVGKPTRTGAYHFTVSASNGNAVASPQHVEINVDINPQDKPVFKPHYSFASATPDKEYRLDLMGLIETRPSFGVTNQVHFRIDPNHTTSYPSWINMDEESQTLLHGHVPSAEAGQTKELIIIASSNTGGDSKPLTMHIPVAFDPAKKPIFEKGLELKGAAGAGIRKDFLENITDPATDSSLRIILDKVEPAAPWLSVSSLTVLEGGVPEDAVGQVYQVTLYANTVVGGNSDPVTIPLQIAIDKNKTPHFYSDNPQLPLFYAGQPYSYDFVGNNDVYPEYRSFPYVVELAKGHNNPEWLRIEDNKIIADSVPNNLKKIQTMFITIKNIQGGQSEVLSLLFVIMK